METTRDEVLKLVLKSEGGLNENEPEHVGGVSYAGITQQAYDGWRKNVANPFSNELPISVRDLEGNDRVIHAFYEDYFTKYHVWELPECLQYIFADFVVNAGSAAVKIIQMFAGVDHDGIWGSGTSDAVQLWKMRVEKLIDNDLNVDNDLITSFHEQKIAHYERLAEANPAKYGKFLAGWKRRANNVLGDLSHYFENDEPTPKAHDEDDHMLQVETTITDEAGMDYLESVLKDIQEGTSTWDLIEHIASHLPTETLLKELKKRTGI